MARSVVLNGTPRCEVCRHPPRWCICAGLAPVDCPIAVDVVQHASEVHKPTSTGSLILRTVPGSRAHVFRHDQPLHLAEVARPGHELWVIHPAGEPAPERTADSPPIQALLLDASWSQARALMRECESFGRRVSLPMRGESRYWLRTQNGEGRFSTVEALLFLLESLGHRPTAAALRLQFELHVYAGLRTRGRLRDAELYLSESPIRTQYPELLAKLG